MFDLKETVRSVTKLISRKDVLIILLLICSYFITRLTFLDGFPIFSDEGIYLRWAKVAWHDPAWRFISLTDGKQPLQTWGTIPFLKLFSTNALLAGRLFAVSTGLFALTGIGALLMYLFGKRAAFFGMLFYILTPYFLFYDRLALVDSGVNAFFIWIFFFSIVVANTLRLDMALLFGLLSGFGLLAKSSVRLFLGLSVLAPVTNMYRQKTYKNKVWYTVNYFVLYIIGATLALLIYNIQRLSPFFHYIEEKNKTFLLTFGELIHNPFAVVFYNIPHLPLYVFWESAFVVSIIGLVGWYLLGRKNLFLFLYFSAWIVLPYIVIVFMTKV
jgi:4-amino-4-deoxy-L-arabinose transferase-like glycosyltransferase